MSKYVGAWAIYDEDYTEGLDVAFSRYKEAGLKRVMYGGVAHSFDVHHEYYQDTCIDPMLEIDYEAANGDQFGTKCHLINSDINEVRKLAASYGIDIGLNITPGVSEPIIAKYPELAVEDIEGRKSSHWMCPSNPDVRAYFIGRIKDIILHNSGIKEVELDVVGLDFYDPQVVPDWVLPELYPLRQIAIGNCFCKHCTETAERNGIDVNQLKPIIRSLYKEATTLTYEKFTDLSILYRGIFDIVRVFLKYPILIHWLRHRASVVSSFVNEVYKNVHVIDPSILISSDLVAPSFSWALGQSYADQPLFTDITKLMFYHKRIGGFESKPLKKIQAEIPEISDREILDQYYRLKGFSGPGSISELSEKGLDVENIYYETRKAKIEVGNNHKIVVGLVGDQPATPKDVEDAVLMAHKGGADGYFLHLWYGNAPKENVLAFGDTLKRIGEI
jgi:hypothetical protein